MSEEGPRCRQCGAAIDAAAPYCANCGAAEESATPAVTGSKSHGRFYLVLSSFVGAFCGLVGALFNALFFVATGLGAQKTPLVLLTVEFAIFAGLTALFVTTIRNRRARDPGIRAFTIAFTLVAGGAVGICTTMAGVGSFSH